MKNWNEIRPIVEQILTKAPYKNGERCFLTAYQIAVLVDKQDTKLKGDLPIGGKNQGGDDNSSFAQKIAWNLSKDINDNILNGQLERQFLSIKGLDKFTFDDGKEPSGEEFSMFRLT